METVNNIAAAASKAIWGEPEKTTDEGVAKTENETIGQEPLSGVQGDVGKGELFDKGNYEPSTAKTDSVLGTTKVLPLRPASEAPIANEDIETNEELPAVPSTSTSMTERVKEREKAEAIVKPTPFISKLKEDVESNPSLDTGASATAVKGAGGSQIPGTTTVDDVKVGEPKVPETTATTQKMDTTVEPILPEISIATTLKTETTSKPIIPMPSKENAGAIANGEDSGSGSETKEGKEKLSLKDKIKAKLHHKH